MNKFILLIIILFNISFSEIVLSGFITDESTGEALIGANVFISNTNNGVTTDKNGFYSIVVDENINNSFERPSLNWYAQKQIKSFDVNKQIKCTGIKESNDWELYTCND